MNLQEITVYIIALNGKPRNANLLKQIRTIFTENQIEIVDAITPNQMDQDYLLEVSGLGSTVLGRQISKVEIAVTQSHRKCYELAITKNSAMALIFEDDVDIIDTDKLQKTLVEHKDSVLPVISTLYTPMWGIWKYSLENFWAVIPPAYACSYLINLSAMQIALENESIGLADWPIWSEKIYFQLVVNDVINQINTESTIEKFRRLSIEDRMKFSLFYFFRALHALGTKTYLLQRIYYPYLWKKYLIKEVKAGNRKKTDNSSIFLIG